ncbi:hypothetical protein [Leptothoe sp. PORK10 BA2]|uniref:hypothetical protein n=1 Tax=Leptothoe sp. PORK10 BA2 TaxID=3110254 RepID=UPI002B1F2A9E|nr:hypothetical protein [Leptothoe sp. PORK10 BA2]MEA5467160.1 hypothetical protein [Leptothoe sp. PORK10 BA2]
MCVALIQSQLHELIEKFHTADRCQQRKLVTRILSLAQQSDKFWQGISIDAEPYAEAYQAVMILLPRKLSQFDPSNLTFVQWLNRWLVVETLARSPKIWRGGGNTDPAIYEEAKQIAMNEILNKFKEYDSKKGSVTNWFNFILKKRILDVTKDWGGKGGREVPLNDGYGEEHCSNQSVQITSESDEIEFDLPNLPGVTPDISLTRNLINRIRQWAEEKHSELRQCCLRNRSEVNCYTLILMRLPRLVERQDKFEFSDVPKWEMTATELNVPESTVRCHFTNQCIRHLKQAFPDGSYA